MIISRTPLRMSFLGGGSDFREYYKHGFGSVVSAAINKYVYVIITKGFCDKIWVSYSKTEYVDSVDQIEHNLIREALKIVGIKKGVSICYISDLLPNHEGSGLGASSSLAIGILNSLYEYVGKTASPEQLAKEACEIEIEKLKHPMGKQDQYASAFGGFNYIKFNADESVQVEPINLGKEKLCELRDNLLIFYTGIVSSSKCILPEQEKNILMNKEKIDRLVALSLRLKESMNLGKTNCLGEMLHENWLLKKSLASNISNNKIDSYYQKAIEAGAIGGKILGSGGGGFLLLYCEKSKQGNVRIALSDLKEFIIDFEFEGSKIILNDQKHHGLCEN